MTKAEERRFGWAITAFVLVMVAGPLAGSSVIVALVAVCRALAG